MRQLLCRLNNLLLKGRPREAIEADRDGTFRSVDLGVELAARVMVIRWWGPFFTLGCKSAREQWHIPGAYFQEVR
jgi:hypothetical protein